MLEIINKEKPLSNNYYRNKLYVKFITDCHLKVQTIKQLITFSVKLMKSEKLHPHFFGNNTLYDNAEYLVLHSLKLSYGILDRSIYLDKIITAEDATNAFDLIERRIALNLPVEYLTNEAWYNGRRFLVNSHTLVPRSLISNRFDYFLEKVKWTNFRVLDLCTGSGCIGITLALMNNKIRVDLADISISALKIAAENIKLHNLDGRVNCIQSNLFENIKDKYDLIITNPPYVSTNDYHKIPMEFKREPKIALEAGKDGLKIIDNILVNASQYLESNGLLVAEVGYKTALNIKTKYFDSKFIWYKYLKPDGREPFLGYDCAFSCWKKDLLNIKSVNKSYFKKIIYYIYHKIRFFFI